MEGRRNFMILSTCNRTELYGYGFTIEEFKEIFKRYTSVGESEIADHLIARKGKEAIYHLFKVSSGLESQIIGDYEIAGQIRSVIRIAREEGMISGFFQKILETTLQVGKAVRTQTSISDGTTSTSYAIIQHLKKYGSQNLNICLIGWGKIGLTTFRNIRQHLPDAKLTILNRTYEKLIELEKEYQLKVSSLNSIEEVLPKANVVIVATAADLPILNASMLQNTPVKLVFDLSVPANVSADVYALKNLNAYNIDDLSAEINRNLERRMMEVPQVLEIIERHIELLFSWQERKIIRSVYL